MEDLPFPPFPATRFELAMIDPPWHWKARSAKGDDRAPPYPRVSLEMLKRLQPLEVLRRDCAIALWVVDTHIPQALALAEAWGMTFKTVLFYWVKQTKHGRWHVGMGKTTRANPEQCWLLTRGEGLPIRAHDVHRLIVAPVREHSRKPDEARTRLERLFGDVSRIELFARETAPGWTPWGIGIGHAPVSSDLPSPPSSDCSPSSSPARREPRRPPRISA